MYFLMENKEVPRRKITRIVLKKTNKQEKEVEWMGGGAIT